MRLSLRFPAASARVASAAARRAPAALRASAPSAPLAHFFSTSSSPVVFPSSSSSPGRGPEPLLFTPGPLTTSHTVKAAMQTDLGSRDPAFLAAVREVREGLLRAAGVGKGAKGHECVIMQGSGTFGVEATIGSCFPKSGGGKLLIAINGAYGHRMASMAKVLGIPHTTVVFEEWMPVDVAAVLEKVKSDTAVTHVAVVHHETTAGVLNDIDTLGKGLHALSSSSSSSSSSSKNSNNRPPITFVVDSMSAFGAYPVNVRDSHVHFLVSSSNKCIEGVPGFSFTIASTPHLQACKGNARSLSLDLHAQWAGLEANGQFRFTPPTHAILAFRQALRELEAEGGTAARLARYQNNFEELTSEMAKLGFTPYVTAPGAQGCIITTFLVPDDKNFVFNTMYNQLEKRGFVIYPGKTTAVDSFRLGSIGRLFPHDMRMLVKALEEVLRGMGVRLPVTQKREQR